MLNWLKLQEDVQMLSEYHFAAPKNNSVDYVYCF
jgi:hypothetical protein